MRCVTEAKKSNERYFPTQIYATLAALLLRSDDPGAALMWMTCTNDAERDTRKAGARLKDAPTLIRGRGSCNA